MWGRLFGRDESTTPKDSTPEAPKPVEPTSSCPWKDCSCGASCKCGASCSCGTVRK